MGSFDTIHRHETPEKVADKLKEWAAQNQGVAAEEFLNRVTADLLYAVRKMNSTRAAFAAGVSQTLGLTNAPPLIGRVLGHFGIVAAAGELATECGVTGWPEGEAIRAASATFVSWFLLEYKAIENLQKGVRQVRAWIEANKDRLKKSEIKNGHLDYCVDVDEFRNAACAGFDYLEVARKLKAEGSLVHDSGGLTLQRRDGSQRYDIYCVRVSVQVPSFEFPIQNALRVDLPSLFNRTNRDD